MKREHGPGTADSEPAKKAKVTPAMLTKADLFALPCGTRIAWNSHSQAYASALWLFFGYLSGVFWVFLASGVDVGLTV